MDIPVEQKISRLNELFLKSESGIELDQNELKEQGLYREEIIEFFKFACLKNKNIKKS